MCLKSIKKWFVVILGDGNIAVPAADAVSPPPPQPLAIPRPEEPPDPTLTINNVNLNAAVDKWIVDYNVPQAHYSHWKNSIVIHLDANLPYPAAAYELRGVRHLTIRPEWVNSGVIAHEQAHNSYALLTEQQKVRFSAKFTPLKTEDRLIAYLFSVNSYGLTNDIEGHAEVYRYLAEKMPQELKEYYPKLF